MFNKTKRKIVFTVAYSLLALMIVTLTTIYLSNRIAIDRESREMLRIFAERFSLEEQPLSREEEIKPDGTPDFMSANMGEPREPRDNGPWKNEPAFRLSTFYSVAYSKSGEVLAVNNENHDLQSEESLLETASSILKKGRKNGKYGNMTYLVEERDDYTLVAMIDGTINDNNQTRLFRQMLIIGLIATVVLFVISIFIARWIVRPLEENDRRQKQFVSDAGHELKTPIAVISANSELLKRQIGNNEWLSNINYENERMSDLVKQLLFLSKAENRDVPKETLDFSKLVDGEALPFEPLAFEKGKRIESEIESGLFVEGNSSQLRQLVSILLDNALSHGIGDTIGLSLKKERHSAVLSVSNDAEELSEDQLARLFDRFYRADEARTRVDAHYGLGLSIARAVTDAHGGQIHAEYRKPKAIFIVTLPLRK